MGCDELCFYFASNIKKYKQIRSNIYDYIYIESSESSNRHLQDSNVTSVRCECEISEI